MMDPLFTVGHKSFLLTVKGATRGSWNGSEDRDPHKNSERSRLVFPNSLCWSLVSIPPSLPFKPTKERSSYIIMVLYVVSPAVIFNLKIRIEMLIRPPSVMTHHQTRCLRRIILDKIKTSCSSFVLNESFIHGLYTESSHNRPHSNEASLSS